MPPLSEAPEGRPLDENGVPIRTPAEIEQTRILNARIAREKALYEAGMPVAGHDPRQHDDGGRER